MEGDLRRVRAGGDNLQAGHYGWSLAKAHYVWWKLGAERECLPEEEFWRTSQGFKLFGFVEVGPWCDGYGVYGIDPTSVPVWCEVQGDDMGGALGVQAHPIPT
jgi:hypothetical protein